MLFKLNLKVVMTWRNKTYKVHC